MAKWIRFDKSPFGMYGAIIIFDKIAFYAGKAGTWGISVEIDFYDRSLMFQVLNLYMGFEIYHKQLETDE